MRLPRLVDPQPASSMPSIPHRAARRIASLSMVVQRASGGLVDNFLGKLGKSWESLGSVPIGYAPVMSQFYRPHRTRNLYKPGDAKPFAISRSKIDLFVECPRCFYIDRRLGTGRPPGFPFNLNSAVDTLLKTEFDQHRTAQTPHPIMSKYGLAALPAQRDELDEWRENFKGVQTLHAPTNLKVTGAIDDLWLSDAGEYLVVDYKATSKNEPITALDKDWHIGYKRQMEVYQWLLRANGLTVSDTGYFVYCNGDASAAQFNEQLRFDVTLIAYTGSDDWVAPTLGELHACLQGDDPPVAGSDCDYCAYFEARGEVTGARQRSLL